MAYTQIPPLPQYGDDWSLLGESMHQNITQLVQDVDALMEGGPGANSWNDLTDKPDLAPVATSGSYDDLTNKPTISDDITRYLPPMKLPPRGTIRTVNRVNVNASTQWPDPVSWTEDSLLKIIIQNPADAGQNLNLGYGLYGNPNNQGTPNVVQPGKEWVGPASSLPIFGRMDTKTEAILVISERSA